MVPYNMQDKQMISGPSLKLDNPEETELEDSPWVGNFDLATGPHVYAYVVMLACLIYWQPEW